MRQQLSKVVDITISPPRLRYFLDSLGINSDIEEKLREPNSALFELRKKDGPEVPKPLNQLSRNATDEEKKRHADEKTKYMEELKKYSDYTSPEYKKNQNVYQLCKVLMKVHSLLLKKNLNNNQRTELNECYDLLMDKISRKTNETDEEYKKRVDEHKAFEYKSLIGKTNFKDPDEIQNFISRMKKEYPNLIHFFNHDEYSKTKIRFNDPAMIAIAVAMEMGIEELIEWGIRYMNQINKKTLQPEHCIGEIKEDNEILSPKEECIWFVLFRHLPHLKALVDRRKRRLDFESEKKTRRSIRKKKRHDTNAFDSFAEYEANTKDKDGKYYARKVEVPSTDKDGNETVRYIYEWKGIDYEDNATDEDDEDEFEARDFRHYIGELCKKVIKRTKSENETDIKVSDHFRCFFSNIIIDFIVYIAPQIRILINMMNIKTVTADIIKAVLKLIICREYISPTGQCAFDDDHEQLFINIDKKIALLKTHRTDTKKPSDESDGKQEQSEDSSTSHQEDSEPVVEKPRRKKVVKKTVEDVETEEQKKETVEETPKTNGVKNTKKKTVKQPVQQ